MMSETPLEFRLERRAIFVRPDAPLYAHSTVVHGNHGAHDHDFMEIALMLGGQGIHVSPRGQHRIAAGHAVFLRPGAWHAYANCQRLRVFNCCFAPELLQRELAWMLESAGTNALLRAGPLGQRRQGVLVLKLPKPAVRRCQAHLQALQRLTQNPAPQEALLGLELGHLTLLLAELANHLPKGEAPQKIPSPHPAVARGVQLLEAHLAESWTLLLLAERLNTDPSYLSRLFKSATGLPPMAYLARRRAERAAAMLLRTQLPISAIGSQVGWEDPNYFARRFKAHFAMPATMYRERFRSG